MRSYLRRYICHQPGSFEYGQSIGSPIAGSGSEALADFDEVSGLPGAGSGVGTVQEGVVGRNDLSVLALGLQRGVVAGLLGIFRFAGIFVIEVFGEQCRQDLSLSFQRDQGAAFDRSWVAVGAEVEEDAGAGLLCRQARHAAEEQKCDDGREQPLSTDV